MSTKDCQERQQSPLHIRVVVIHVRPTFSKEEAVLEVSLVSPTNSIHIRDLTEPTSNPRRRIDGHESVPRPVLVHAVPSRAVGIIKTFDDFWSQKIPRVRNVEARAVVKVCLVRWEVGCVPGKGLGSNAGQSAVVEVVTASDESEAEINVPLGIENLATQDEITTVETLNYVSRLYQSSG